MEAVVSATAGSSSGPANAVPSSEVAGRGWGTWAVSAGFLGVPQSRSAMGLKTRGRTLSEARISRASQTPRTFGRARRKP